MRIVFEKQLEKAKAAITKAEEFIHYKMQDAYFERFDELFPYMIEEFRRKLTF